MIYSPAEDSLLLQKQVKKYAKNKSVLDVGTGSGVQALAAIESKAKSVTASDIDANAVKHAQSLDKNIKAIKSDLFSKIKGKFDLIIFNPPYLPLDEREPEESRLQTTGGKKGDEIILRFLKQSIRHLNKNGIILLLLSSLTPKNRINNILTEIKLKPKVISSLRLSFESLEVWLIK